ncbi:hypothetical protein [Streptomyces mirabilis]|uniref:hypothetical protein n=1 Tax=Streptomyces mirabilis TaxID=68239 RepID=UPI00332C2C0C
MTEHSVAPSSTTSGIAAHALFAVTASTTATAAKEPMPASRTVKGARSALRPPMVKPASAPTP